ncbi:MAG: carbon-nitrogen hydrolase family protein [Bacillota bacterium]
MKTFKVALLQMAAAGPDQSANQAKADAFCRRAHAMGADLALFPEMWNNGYDLPAPEQHDDPEVMARWTAGAVTADGPFVGHFAALARELGMAIAVTYLEKWPGLPRNTVTVLGRHGRPVLTYAKSHTCEFDAEAALTQGDGFRVADLEIEAGTVKVGAMICYDREFPESARILMLQGAEVILVPNACGMEINRLTQLRSRAYENMVGVALANYAAPQENGHSVAYDGIAFSADERSLDMTLVEAGRGEGVYLATFDLDALRAYRVRETWGNAFRRPELYGPLTSTAVDPPFVRRRVRRSK